MRKTMAFAAVILLSLSTAAFASETIQNWSAPMTWTPHSAQATGGRSALVSTPLPFVPVTPCRVADTRGNGFTGAYGPPSLAAGVPRNFPITGQCGISAGAAAVSFNFTVVNTLGPGFLKVFPQGGVAPTVSTLNYVAGQIIANAAIVPLGGGGLTAVAGVSGFDLLIDVNGYYNETTTTGAFTMINPTGGGILGESLNGGIGVYGFSTGSGGWGVFGTNDSATGYGVYGFSSGPAIGVYGVSGSNVGTKGFSTNYNGVWAESTNQDGLFASGGRDGAYIQGARYGVFGVSLTAGTDYAGVNGSSAGGTRSAGVLGTNTTALYAAGVKGSVGSGPADNYWAWAGVRGVSDNIGVLGISTSAGVVGAHHTSAGVMQTASYLGYDSVIGLHTIGTTTATGTKFFVEPHPTDPTKVIRYAALEGPEAGTYFRGKAVVQGGVAEIVVPESFRFVTDEEGLTVHVTPVGRAAQAWIESADLNRIVIGSNRDVTINYIVHGVRKAYKDIEVIAENIVYVPTSATMPIPSAYPEETRRRLVANGTYNPDGTVNMNTAERMGWAQKWHDDEAQAKAAQEAAVAKAK